VLPGRRHPCIELHQLSRQAAVHRRGNGRRAARGGTGQEQQVLVVEVVPQVQHLETRAQEQAAQGGGRKVAAVLVVHVPEGTLGEDAPGIGHLEKQQRAGTADRGAQFPKKVTHRGNVLERVATGDESGTVDALINAPELALHLPQVALAGPGAARNVGGIVADAAVGTGAAQGGEKLAFATADLEHLPATYPVRFHQAMHQRLQPAPEGGRAALALLAVPAVTLQRRIETAIEDEPAMGAGNQLQRPARKRQRRLPGRQHAGRVHGQRGHAVEAAPGAATAGGTTFSHGRDPRCAAMAGG
jgi:hypothetical protein